MRIAIDFDGTIVEHRYPEIGKERPMACMTLRQLQEEGHQLVLWTVREGELLEAAVEWCKERGIIFYAVNANYAGETPNSPDYSRKIVADLYIDDRMAGGLPHWSIIYQLIRRKCTLEHYLRREITESMQAAQPAKPKHWWQRR